MGLGGPASRSRFGPPPTLSDRYLGRYRIGSGIPAAGGRQVPSMPLHAPSPTRPNLQR